MSKKGIFCCILFSLLLTSLDMSWMKYVLVFLVGMILLFLIYLFTSLCGGGMEIVLASLGIILVICIGTDLIMAAFEIYIFRHISVVFIGIMFIVLASFIIGFDSESAHILISTYGLIILSCILACLLLSNISLLSLRYYFVFLIGLIIFFSHYFAKSIREGDMVIEFKFFCTDMAICGIIDLIMATFEKFILPYISVIIISFILFFLLLVFTECGKANIHALLSGTGLIISLCYLVCWWLGYRGIFFLNYFVVFAVWLMLLFAVYFIISVINGDMDIVKQWSKWSSYLGIAAELVLGSFDSIWIRVLTIYLFFGVALYYGVLEKSNNYKWWFKTIAVIIATFVASLACMLFGCWMNPIVQILFVYSGIPTLIIVVPWVVIDYCLYLCGYRLCGKDKEKNESYYY